jgi:hypothetical protein
MGGIDTRENGPWGTGMRGRDAVSGGNGKRSDALAAGREEEKHGERKQLERSDLRDRPAVEMSIRLLSANVRFGKLRLRSRRHVKASRLK